MRVATVRELLDNEYRVGLTPDDVREYVKHGHEVIVEHKAGLGSGFPDAAYAERGATIVNKAAEVWAGADMVVKVKAPVGEELSLMHEQQIVFSYLHLAAGQELVDALLQHKVTGVAYETVKDMTGKLPLLNPMSQIAGRLAVFAGAKALETPNGGAGLLLSGVPGVRSANVLIIGGGVAGTNAAIMARGMGARVTIMDISLRRLEELDLQFDSQIGTLFSNESNIEEALREADLVISTVLLPGAKAPKLIRREHLKTMKKGSVIVDIAIDQGGSTEVSRPTTHSNPTYIEEGVVLYCVANMPGAVPYTSTKSLTNATLKYGLALADKGLDALREDSFLRQGLNTLEGHITNRGVAEAWGRPFVDPLDLLN